jgi:hypothetical protein
MSSLVCRIARQRVQACGDLCDPSDHQSVRGSGLIGRRPEAALLCEVGLSFPLSDAQFSSN